MACKRTRGRHTFDVTDAAIEQSNLSYGLLGKVVTTVTDNASNFAKAIKIYQPINSESDSELEEDSDEDVTFTDFSEAQLRLMVSFPSPHITGVHCIPLTKCPPMMQRNT